MPVTALALVLLTPVPGPIARPFSYVRTEPFVAGRHRGTDFRAAPGATVRAACAGRVVAVRPRVVTVRCGSWRVTHLPLAPVSVRLGSTVPAGAVIGRVGRLLGHVGLHLGVRRADDRFGYVDPERFLTDRRTEPPPAAPRRVPRTAPPTSRPAPVMFPAPVAPPALAPAALAPAALAPPASLAPVPVGATPGSVSERTSPPASLPAPPGVGVRVSSRSLAPWPAWAGLVLLLLGSAGSGVRIRRRRRRAATAVAVASRS